jgi:transcriptional regulator with XRE-family HTH domain
MEAKDYVIAIRGRGLTQEQIAEKTGIPQPTVSKIERGEVSDVMSRTYRALQNLHAKLEKDSDAKSEPVADGVGV